MISPLKAQEKPKKGLDTPSLASFPADTRINLFANASTYIPGARERTRTPSRAYTMDTPVRLLFIRSHAGKPPAPKKPAEVWVTRVPAGALHSRAHARAGGCVILIVAIPRRAAASRSAKRICERNRATRVGEREKGKRK
jgi:hypothetical protein